ncbi:unnamed protein product, partial [Didymodactylos carnosus]
FECVRDLLQTSKTTRSSSLANTATDEQVNIEIQHLMKFLSQLARLKQAHQFDNELFNKFIVQKFECLKIEFKSPSETTIPLESEQSKVEKLVIPIAKYRLIKNVTARKVKPQGTLVEKRFRQDKMAGKIRRKQGTGKNSQSNRVTKTPGRKSERMTFLKHNEGEKENVVNEVEVNAKAILYDNFQHVVDWYQQCPTIIKSKLDKFLLEKLEQIFHAFSITDENNERTLTKYLCSKWILLSSVISPFNGNIIDGCFQHITAKHKNRNFVLHEEHYDSITFDKFIDLIVELTQRVTNSRTVIIAEYDSILKKLIHSGEQYHQKIIIRDFVEVIQQESSTTTYVIDEVVDYPTSTNEIIELMRENLQAHNILSNEQRERLQISFRSHVFSTRNRIKADKYQTLTKKKTKMKRKSVRAYSQDRLALSLSTLTSWLRQCGIFSGRYAATELGKDFLAVISDYQSRKLYPMGVRGLDFDGFLTLIYRVSLSSQCDQQDVIQKILCGPRRANFTC